MVRILASLIVVNAALVTPARAYINQVDGTIVPQTARMQQCLDRPGTGETAPGAVDAIVDAAILPEAYRPVEMPAGSGRYPVTFQVIGEGAGYRNNFGWFWVGTDVTNPANLFTVFDCRPGAAACACPCDPNAMRVNDGTSLAHTRTIDFSTQPGFAVGRPIGLWLRTPERLDGTGNDPDNCGNRTDTVNRIYFTSKALNDDGDYVHFLVYRSATRTNTFYFGFEDLFRGGDNDFEDMLVRSTGLVPLCDPRPETCNNADDDCDMAVDEGVTMACSTACGAGTRTCTAGTFGPCSARIPGGESCNAIDDDCDSRVDEGLTRACMSACGAGSEVCVAGAFVDCSAPRPTIETCDGRDQDCDGRIDEGITRACASACGSGTETCTAGVFGGCTAPAPRTEVCDGDDDDCDRRVDEGITRACTSACGTGTETCISGAFVGCTAPDPRVEACNNLDDDCDGTVDEGLLRACSTSCGVGNEVCTRGTWGACDAPTPTTETCNNIDDDCDGVIDDGNPGGGAACLPRPDGGYDEVPEGGGEPGCMPGRVRCVAGTLQCDGATSGTREICNCEDDDCDGVIDEDMGGTLCPGGACIGCACASPCADGEFPCPPGRICDTSFADPERMIPGFCVAGMCAGVTCTDEETCDPLTGECRNLCSAVMCPSGFACVRGACVEDNCYGRGCPAGQRCRDGACEVDPCAGTTCGEGTFCRDGLCISVCPASCPAGEVCRDGACAPSECEEPCAEGESCLGGACVRNACVPSCGRGRVCRGTECVDDPCGGVTCPGGSTCRDGECGSGGMTTEPPRSELGLAAGGGGCACTTAQSRRQVPWAAVAMVGLLGLLLAWRRRKPGAGTLAVLMIGMASGCDVEPYCFEGCEDADAGPPRDAGRDARPADGCVATGEESCNGLDDDCNGIVDDGFDLMNDPAHCGACETACSLPHAFPDCAMGACVIERCELGFHDIDGVPANGCEYECPPSGAEECNLRDDDCDTRTDEGFDLMTDVANCGVCGTFCSFPNASATCEAGACVMGPCNTGFVDLDGLDDNGCEYRCTATGVEACNEVDDDCDMVVDEGFSLMTDPMNCGSCGTLCSFPHATESCVMGVCGIASCEAGWLDADGNPLTGCEYMCTPMGAETCNGRDDDCDGSTDETDPMAGTPCGIGTGACEPGVQACVLGALACLGDRGPTPETCNGIDDDCNGAADDGMIGGTGVRCGESNVGRCRFGTVVCTGGALGCGGGYVGPVAETCNGVDDDCDGTTDDSPAPPGAPPPSCALTRGVCAGRAPICMGAAGWSCTFPATYQATETICDMLDNDCDGTTDEGCLRPAPATDVRVDLGDAAGAANSLSPYLSGDGAARLYAAWMDLRGGTVAHVYFNRSVNSGDTWASGGTPSFPVLIDTAGGVAFNPAIAVTSAGRDVNVVWSDFRGGTSYREIYSRTDVNFGQTWSAANVRINPGQNTDSFGIDLAVEGTNVYVVYENVGADRRSRHIYFARSADGGVSWMPPVLVDNGVGTSFVAAQPRVAAAGANVYVIWRDNRNGGLDVFVDRSTMRGAAGSFGADRRLDVGTTAGASSSFSPVIAAEGSNVYAAWVDDRDMGSFDIWTNVSRDGGGTWLAADAVRIDADPLRHDSIQPRIVAPAAGRAVVAWIDYRHGFPDIFAARTEDAALTWRPPARLDTGTMPGTASSLDLTLGASGSRIAAAWADDRNGLLDIYANFSLDGAANWQPSDQRLDATMIPGSSDSERPSIFVTPTAAHVIWVDHRSGPNGDIYFRRLQ